MSSGMSEREEAILRKVYLRLGVLMIIVGSSKSVVALKLSTRDRRMADLLISEIEETISNMNEPYRSKMLEQVSTYYEILGITKRKEEQEANRYG